MRPAIAVVLVFAQAVAAFGFPLIQTRKNVKACGCVTPCGSATDNCCCAKLIAPVPEPKRPGCAKCREQQMPVPSSATSTEDSPSVTWVASFKVRQCRGESPMGLLAELPAIPPVVAQTLHAAPVCSDRIAIGDSRLVSHVMTPLDPPPRLV